jgi:hypothetical protein
MSEPCGRRDSKFVLNLSATDLTESHMTGQKIDKLKSQLTAQADLFNPGSLDDRSDAENDLNEDELQILRDSGIIAGPSTRKARNRRTAPKHIVFVDNEDQGMSSEGMSTAYVDNLFSAAVYIQKNFDRR